MKKETIGIKKEQPKSKTLLQGRKILQRPPPFFVINQQTQRSVKRQFRWRAMHISRHVSVAYCLCSVKQAMVPHSAEKTLIYKTIQKDFVLNPTGFRVLFFFFFLHLQLWCGAAHGMRSQRQCEVQ